MSHTWIAVVLALVGAITTMAGAALYILLGPAVPVLVGGVAMLTSGIAMLCVELETR